MQVPRSRDGRRSWRCALGFHAWVGHRRGNGERYIDCDRCGKSEPWSPNDDRIPGGGWMG